MDPLRKQAIIPTINTELNVITSEEDLRLLDASEYSQKYIFVGMLDSAQISKRGNLVINVINPSLVDLDYLTSKKHRGIFGFISPDVQVLTLKAIEKKFLGQPVGNTTAYFKLGKLLPTLITCTVQSSRSVHPPFLMCETIEILSYSEYTSLATHSNIPKIREVITASLEKIKSLNDDPNVPFSILESESPNDNVDLIRNFKPSELEELRQARIAEQLLKEKAENEAKALKRKPNVDQTVQKWIQTAPIQKKAESFQHILPRASKTNVADDKTKEVTLTNDKNGKVETESNASKVTSNSESVTKNKDEVISPDDQALQQKITKDKNFFEMDIPVFSTQAEPQQLSKPKAIHIGDVEFISDSDESDYDMATGKRKESSKTPSLYEPALKKPKQTNPVEKKLFFADSNASLENISKEEEKKSDSNVSLEKLNVDEKRSNFNVSLKNLDKSEKRSDSVSSGFFSDDNDFYGESNMAEAEKENDKHEDEESSKQPQGSTGIDVLSNFFGNVPVKPTKNKDKGVIKISKVLKKPELSLQKLDLSNEKNNLEASNSKAMKIFSMAEENISSESVIPATAEPPSNENNPIEEQEIIISQSFNQTPIVEMVSRGTQTPMNFFTFNVLYSQAVSSATVGQNAAETANIPDGTVTKTRKQLKKERKMKANELKAQQISDSNSKSNSVDINSNSVESDAKIEEDPQSEKKVVKIKESVPLEREVPKVVESMPLEKASLTPDTNSNKPIETKVDEVTNELKKEKKVKEKSQIPVKESKPILIEEPKEKSVPKSRELVVPSIPTVKAEKLKTPVAPFQLKPDGHASKINRLIKNIGVGETIKCVVVGMVPFDSSIDLNKYGMLILNVVEISDYNFAIKKNKFDGLVTNIHVRNTASLADVFKAKTGEDLYAKMVKIFFCNTTTKEIEFTIKREQDGKLIWVHKNFAHEDLVSSALDSHLQNIYPVKRGDQLLPTSRSFEDLDISSIGTFSTNVLLVGIRCKKDVGGARYRLLVTDFTESQYLRNDSIGDITMLGDQSLNHVYEVFIGNDVIAESLISELQRAYGNRLNDFNFQFAASSMYFDDLKLSHLGIVLSLKYSTKFYANMLDIRYLTSTLLKYEKGFAGSIEAMKQLKSLYDNYNSTIPKHMLGMYAEHIQVCMPYSYIDKEYVLFAGKYSKKIESDLKKQVDMTLEKIKDTDKLSTYEKVVETSTLKGLIGNKHNTNIIFQLTNYQFLGATYMSNGCVEFEVGIVNEKGSFKVYTLPQTNIQKMFSKRDNPGSTYPVVYSEILKLQFPTNPKSPIFLCAYKMDFRGDGNSNYYWVVTGFFSLW